MQRCSVWAYAQLAVGLEAHPSRPPPPRVTVDDLGDPPRQVQEGRRVGGQIDDEIECLRRRGARH